MRRHTLAIAGAIAYVYAAHSTARLPTRAFDAGGLHDAAPRAFARSHAHGRAMSPMICLSHAFVTRRFRCRACSMLRSETHDALVACYIQCLHMRLLRHGMMSETRLFSLLSAARRRRLPPAQCLRRRCPSAASSLCQAGMSLRLLRVAAPPVQKACVA